MWEMFSNVSPFLISMPFCAALPVETMMATGVARPNAHGQEITSTDTAKLSAVPMLSPTHSHTINATSEMLMTTGTNTDEILSARR